MPKLSQDKPTVGRIVWVWMTEEDAETHGLEVRTEDQPFMGQVLFVDVAANLATVEAVDPAGNRAVVGDITIFDPEEGDAHDQEGGESFATWMPYQKKQHDKHRVENDAAEALTEERSGADIRNR